ncbi:MAG TPA: L-aspartate oxidase [Aeromicrobium sp.]|nr:L-aspartate oxidase [Aeromicrobium sp.]
MRVLVIGSGVAGLVAALESADAGHDVTLLSKSDLAASNTRFAQGGVAVVLGDDDTVAEHVADTLVAGAGLSDPDTVGVLCFEGPDAMRELIDRGVQFDMHDGKLAHGLEAAHSHARILHAGGDATGAGIAYALIEQLRQSPVAIRERTTAVDLVVADGRCTGVRLLDGTTIEADRVVLATGGAGQLFPYTTNPEVATADGVAMALRAGAVAADLEFYQFHPTSLAAPGNFLISEAVRGEGAVLLDVDGNRFTEELAPRDQVARAIAAQMAEQGGAPVRLDATKLGGEFLAKRFPNIDAASRAQGFDWGFEPIPVTPAAHYYMGGVRTDAWGRTSLPGLYAVGEVACNGLHGANRLASNSLLEGAVYGRRVVEAFAMGDAQDPFEPTWTDPIRVALGGGDEGAEPFSRSDLQQLMWDAAGLSRNADDLREAAAELTTWRVPDVTDAKSAEDANLLVVARAVVASALARRESRGGHYRTDYSNPDPAQARHSAVVAR